MEEEGGVSGSFVVISEENSGALCPIFIGVSCAFFALRLLPDPELRGEKWSEIRSRMLRAGAFLGLLVSAVERSVAAAEKSKLLEKLEKAKKEIAELKKRRSEDAKANERVVSIFAAREQSWLDLRRKLGHQIDALASELRAVEAKKERSVSELCEKMKEVEVILQLKDKMIEEAERRRLESEEKLKAAENLAEGFRENLEREKERHSAEISKNKTAFMELVSNQRQLEAEMARTLKQIEAAKLELEEKEELVLMNQRLSVEIVRMHKESERKSRLEMVEKQMVLKEVKSLKAKRKQAEVEALRWKAISESKHDRISLKNLFLKHVNGYKNQEMRKGTELLSFVTDPFITDGTQELSNSYINFLMFVICEFCYI